VLQETFGRESLSLIAGLTWKGFLFRLPAWSIQSEQVVAFLQVLLRHLSGPLLVVWDGAPIHRSARVRDFAAGTAGRLVLARLPAYAPELNPVEYLWGHLKEHELGNLPVRHAHELGHHAVAALRRLRRRPKIIAACWKQSSLNL
jgi:transposase